MENRSFDKLINGLKSTITSYDYYVNFDKVFKEVKDVKYNLNVLNILIGEDNFAEEFKKMLVKNPDVVGVLPILLAVRDKQLDILDNNVVITYDFKENMDAKYYLDFIYKTRLIELFSDYGIKNLVDYVTGIEVGLDTNGRKNRSGSAMGLTVQRIISNISNIKWEKEATQQKIKDTLGIEIKEEYFEYTGNKRFDFVIKNDNGHLFLIETNYYRTTGSKLNETSRSYIKLAENLKHIPEVTFIWITDGLGWLKTKNNLKEAYNKIQYVFNISDLENGLLEQLILEKKK
ncbi:Type II site-specific deoxyribonuclease [Alteracholeplasma palmae J233]|uniref:Type-2 restriction enzyme n=1 Tax=Alteracholeplasma palmae (strain ATCC 49389 / J233) TaxID=1318466 RepID=U4KJJ2_ALTPJ|nr:type II restriction endonuclease [Alteracholeplasma palmae]CCV63609.1 Type II site-specific deoxyribonuclease [Alteracholeplasma palmae J233]